MWPRVGQMLVESVAGAHRTPVHRAAKAADLDKGTVLIMRRDGVTVPLEVQRGVYNLCRSFARGTDQHSDSG